MLIIICSNESLLNKDLKQLKESFPWSGYPNYIINEYFNICIKQKRENLQNFCRGASKTNLFWFSIY